MERLINVQFKKGVLELCVLALLKHGDRYGYELVEALAATIDVAEGTVYPLLRRLSGEELCETYLQESSQGPPRKYYRITAKGRETLAELEGEWNDFERRVRAILKESSERKS